MFTHVWLLREGEIDREGGGGGWRCEGVDKWKGSAFHAARRGSPSANFVYVGCEILLGEFRQPWYDEDVS